MPKLSDFHPDDVKVESLSQVDPNDITIESADTEDSSLGQDISDLGRGALQGASMGFSDEITGAVESSLTDKSYEQARDEARKANEEAQKRSPWLFGGGELAGGLGTMAIPGIGQAGGGTFVASKLPALARLMKAGGTTGALAKAAAVAPEAAALGGLYGAGKSEAKTASGVASDAAEGAAMGAVGGAGLSLAGSAIVPQASKVAQWSKNKLQESFDDIPFLARTKAAYQLGREGEGVIGTKAASREINTTREAAEGLASTIEDVKNNLGMEIELNLAKAENQGIKAQLDDELKEAIDYAVASSKDRIPSDIIDDLQSPTKAFSSKGGFGDELETAIGKKMDEVGGRELTQNELIDIQNSLKSRPQAQRATDEVSPTALNVLRRIIRDRSGEILKNPNSDMALRDQAVKLKAVDDIIKTKLSQLPEGHGEQFIALNKKYGTFAEKTADQLGYTTDEVANALENIMSKARKGTETGAEASTQMDNLMLGLETFEQQYPGTLQKFGLDKKQVQQLMKTRSERSGLLGKQQETSMGTHSSSIGGALIGGVSHTPYAAANLAGQGIEKVLSTKANILASGPVEKVQQMVEKIPPEIKNKLNEKLTGLYNATLSGDDNKRKAFLFTLLQDKDFRNYLSSEDSSTESE